MMRKVILEIGNFKWPTVVQISSISERSWNSSILLVQVNIYRIAEKIIYSFFKDLALEDLGYGNSFECLSL